MSQEIQLVTDRSQIHASDVAEIFGQAGWTNKRQLPDIERMLTNTEVLVMAIQDGRPVGFARAVTDKVFRAFVEDVIVAEDLRGSGIGKIMLARLEEMVRDFGVSRLELTTTAVGFWQRLGYAEKPSTTYMVKYLS